MEKAAQRGIHAVDLGYTIDALVDGAYAGTYWHQGKEIDLVLHGEDRFSQRTQSIEQLPLITPSGDLVRLADVADVSLAAGPEQILRIDRQRAITIRVRPGPGIALAAASNHIEQVILILSANEVNWPECISFRWRVRRTIWPKCAGLCLAACCWHW